MKRGEFRVWGTVEEKETGRPLPNLIVRAFDRDLVFDDKVGFCTTDDAGRFEIRFTEATFRDVRETRPDLYLRILDPSGSRVIHETTDAIRHDAARDEHFQIVISGSALLPAKAGT